MAWLKMQNPHQAKRQKWLQDEHRRTFTYWVLVALETKTMTAYYLDPMLHQPCDDLKDIVNM